MRTAYFLGNDPAAWRTGIRSYREVVYENLYEGIDLVYRTTGGGMKYEFVLSPGVDPGAITLSYEGIDYIELKGKDGILVHTDVAVIHDAAPLSYQDEKEIACAFVVRTRSSYGFECQGVDHSQILVIDPLVYSTFIGGWNGEFSTAIATDADGNVYVTGLTSSDNFPATPGAYNTSFSGQLDTFVAKLDASGTKLLYATYLGGLYDDTAWTIAVGDSGNAYVTGWTYSTDFPTTLGSFDSSANGYMDSFVVKLNSSGSGLVYSTYLGGWCQEWAWGIAIDSSGNAFVTGDTCSADFPTTPGAFDPTYEGLNYDAFVTKLDAAGSSLLYSTFLGGSDDDGANAIAVDSSGNAYVIGDTASPDYPVSPGAYAETLKGPNDGFVTKLNASGGGLVYSTFIGGSGWDQFNGIAIDTVGNVYATGNTSSVDFPISADAFDPILNGSDAFALKLDSTGSLLLYGTYIGGNDTYPGNPERANSIAVDSSGNAYLTGSTYSDNFPTTPDALDRVFNGGSDSYVAVLNATGARLLYGTYIGSEELDAGWSLVVDSSANIYVTGYTRDYSPPTSFPVTPGAYDTSHNGNDDGFIVKLSLTNAPPTAEAGADQDAFKRTLVTLDGSASSDPDDDLLTFEWSQTAGPSIVLANPNTARLTFTPLTTGVYAFSLSVSDGNGCVSVDSVNVTVVNRSPIASAGQDQTVTTISKVLLDGNASSDADGDALTYSWVQTQGPHVSLEDASNVQAEFLPVAPGVYVFELAVDDGDGGRDNDTLDVTVDVVPIVHITAPANGTKVITEKITVVGVSANANLVQVRVAGREWVNATGVSSWQVVLDMSFLPNGVHVIEARALFGQVESRRDQVTIDLEMQNPMVSVVLVGAGVGGGVVSVAFLLSEPLRVALLALLAIIGAKLRHEDIFESEKRDMIRGYLAANPGANYASIRDDLKLANGTTAYHLRIMERDGFVRSWHDGRFKRFALRDSPLARIPPRITEIELIILQELRNNPGATQEELARVIGVSQRTVSYHMSKLKALGFAEASRRGLRKHYFTGIGGDEAR